MVTTLATWAAQMVVQKKGFQLCLVFSTKELSREAEDVSDLGERIPKQFMR